MEYVCRVRPRVSASAECGRRRQPERWMVWRRVARWFRRTFISALRGKSR